MLDTDQLGLQAPAEASKARHLSHALAAPAVVHPADDEANLLGGMLVRTVWTGGIEESTALCVRLR